jgi:hypothetical protein
MSFVRKIQALGVGAATIGGLILSVVAAPSASAASCPDNGWSIFDGSVGHFFAGNGINIRTGPGTGCTAVGQGQASHNVQFDCWKSGDGGTWTHLADLTTGKEGWVKDSLLVGNGSNFHC